MTGKQHITHGFTLRELLPAHVVAALEAVK